MIDKYPVTSRNGKIYYILVEEWYQDCGYKIHVYDRRDKVIPFINKHFNWDKKLYTKLTSWAEDSKYKDNIKALVILAVEEYEKSIEDFLLQELDKENHLKEFKEWDGIIE